MVLCPKCGCGLIQADLKTRICNCLNDDCKHTFKPKLINGVILKNDDH